MNISVIVSVVSIAVGVVTGAVMALKAVAPHTSTTVDDKIAEDADKALPYLVRLLDWLRARAM